MPYVSCRYAPPDATGMMPETTQGENASIICTDDHGVEWQLTEDSQVGDWLLQEAAGRWSRMSRPSPAPEGAGRRDACRVAD